MNNIFLKIKVFFIFLFSLVFVTNLMSSDSTKYKTIVANNFGIYDFTLKIINESKLFEGYLVFQINKTNDSSQSNSLEYRASKFYFVNKLSDIYIDSLKYLFNNSFNYSIYIESDTTYLCQNAEDYYNFISFKKFFNNYEIFARNVEIMHKPFLWYSLNTSIFDNEDLIFTAGDSDSIGYFIFECLFKTAILKYDYFEIYYHDKSNEHIYFLPTTKVYKLLPVSISNLNKYGFKKSSWFPKELFNK